MIAPQGDAIRAELEQAQSALHLALAAVNRAMGAVGPVEIIDETYRTAALGNLPGAFYPGESAPGLSFADEVTP